MYLQTLELEIQQTILLQKCCYIERMNISMRTLKHFCLDSLKFTALQACWKFFHLVLYLNGKQSVFCISWKILDKRFYIQKEGSKCDLSRRRDVSWKEFVDADFNENLDLWCNRDALKNIYLLIKILQELVLEFHFINVRVHPEKLCRLE